MWREVKIAFSDEIAAINCAVFPAHPWVYGLGQQTDNGAYLSPVNAVTHLAEKLASQGESAEVVIFMVASSTHNTFMESLGQLVDVFPAPAFKQVKRLAESSAALAVEKMQIPARNAGGLPPSMPLSVPTSRSAIAAATIKRAQAEAGAGADMSQLKAQIASFGQTRDALLVDIANGLGDLQKKSARAWVFTSSGNLANTLLQLAKDIPAPSSVYTAAMMMTGADLEGIRSMIHEFEPNAGA